MMILFFCFNSLLDSSAFMQQARPSPIRIPHPVLSAVSQDQTLDIVIHIQFASSIHDSTNETKYSVRRPAGPVEWL